jgi:hypothetical protein
VCVLCMCAAVSPPHLQFRIDISQPRLGTKTGNAIHQSSQLKVSRPFLRSFECQVERVMRALYVRKLHLCLG